MRSRILHIFVSLCIIASVLVVCSCIVRYCSEQINGRQPVVLESTPWTSVGGCGAGGSGGGGGGVRWVGQGISGGLIDIEAMYTASIGQNYNQKTLKAKLSIKPTYTTSLALSVPVVSKTGNLQPATSEENKTEVTGGLGDLSLDLSRSIGMSGEYSLNASLSIPTGQYDIKRGKENSMQYLPSSLQKGSGLFSATLGVGYTKDVEDGVWLVDGSFSYPFAVNFYGKNQHISTEQDMYSDLVTQLEYMTPEQRKRFEYHFKPYGENDLGAFTPPSVSLSIYYGYRGVQNYVHSFGLSLSSMLGVAWVPAFSASGYDPFPDPDHKMYTATLSYGLEFSKPKYPIFVAVALPIHDKANAPSADKYDPEPMMKIDPPDMKDFLQAWTIGIGVKSTMF